MTKDITEVEEIFRSVEKGFDIAFGAGILAVKGAARPMVESVEYAAGLTSKTRENRLGKANQFLPKVSNTINTFLNTQCDIARPSERSIDMTDPDMECDTSIFHLWFCSDASIDDEGTTFMQKEDFADAAIDWVKQVYERIQNSLKLAWTNYGARPRIPNAINPSTNGVHHMTEEGKVNVRVEAQERHNNWLQKVNLEKKNWDQSGKTLGVKEDLSKNL